MTLKKRCQAGEAKLEQVSTALLDLRPEILDHCEAELQEVIGLLESEVLLESERGNSSARGIASDRSSDRIELLRFRNRVRLLALQVKHTTNLCQGWVQLSLSAGYTDQGNPLLPLNEPRSSYEV